MVSFAGKKPFIPQKPRATPEQTLVAPGASGSPIHFINCPFTIVKDNQEKPGWYFDGIFVDHKHRKKGFNTVYLVKLFDQTHLSFGDYAIQEFQDEFRIERKSKEDLFGTISGYHSHNSDEDKAKRADAGYQIKAHWFARQLAELNSLDGHGHIVVECSFPELFDQLPNTQFRPKSLIRTYQSWLLEYPHIHWHFPGPKRIAEVYSFQLMRKFFDTHSEIRKDS